jgi:hypothetical protein
LLTLQCLDKDGLKAFQAKLERLQAEVDSLEFSDGSKGLPLKNSGDQLPNRRDTIGIEMDLRADLENIRLDNLAELERQRKAKSEHDKQIEAERIRSRRVYLGIAVLIGAVGVLYYLRSQSTND